MHSNRNSDMKPVQCMRSHEKKPYHFKNKVYYTSGSQYNRVGDKKPHNMKNIVCNTTLRAVESTVNLKDYYKTMNLNKKTVKPVVIGKGNNVRARKTPLPNKIVSKNSPKQSNKSIIFPDTQKINQTQVISIMPAKHKVTTVIKTKKTLEYNKTKVADVKISTTDELEIKNYNKEMSDDEFDLDANSNLSNVETCIENENLTEKEQKRKSENEIHLDRILDEILITNITGFIKEFTCDDGNSNNSKMSMGDFDVFPGREVESVVFKNLYVNDIMKYKYEKKSNMTKPLCCKKNHCHIKNENSHNKFNPNDYLMNDDPVIKSIQLKEKNNTYFFRRNNDFDSIQIFEGIKEAFKRRFKKKYYVKINKKNNKKARRYNKFLNNYLIMKKKLQKKKMKMTSKQISRKKVKANRFSDRVLWRCKK